MSAGALELWTVYDNPSDHPGWFVARRFVLSKDAGPHATGTIVMGRTLADVRSLIPEGLHCPRMPGDEPQIIETWL